MNTSPELKRAIVLSSLVESWVWQEVANEWSSDKFNSSMEQVRLALDKPVGKEISEAAQYLAILIVAAIRFDLLDADFKRTLNNALCNVENLVESVLKQEDSEWIPKDI